MSAAAITLALAALTATAKTDPAPAPAEPTDLIAQWVRAGSADRPQISVWVNRDDPYQRGDQARVYFKSDRDAYVTILRIDTDGRLRVLFPLDPWEDNWARGGRTFEVLGRDRDEAFRVDDYPGVGYIFAIASSDPFQYDDIVRGDHWDYREISDGRVRGDPYVAVSDLADRIAREGDYDYDVISYDVERHYDYPRFVCYDCHTYASWHYWDPYSSYCSRFRIVIYDDWYYYPYRRYRGGVVIVRPYRPGPRYVFKDADRRNDYITRVAERPRGADPGPRRTSADVGGRGTVPTPVAPRRRTTDDGSRGSAPGRAPSEENRRRPDDGGARPDVRPQNEPRRRTDDGSARPEARPENQPRRRTGDSGSRPDAQPGTEPDRRPADPGRAAPRQGSDERPRRRGIEERPDQSPNNRVEDRGSRSPQRSWRPEAVPDRRPVTREPSARPDRGSSREPRAQPDRGSAREPRSQPRAEPRQAPPTRRAEPRSSKPSGGGAPELRRRRP
jgi:Domain of unknown function (DUF4384)